MSTASTTSPTTASPTTASTGTTASTPTERLRWWNLTAGVFHAVQAVLMLVLSSEVSLAVGATWATGQPGEALRSDRLQEVFTYRLGPAVALFSALSALFHFIVVSPAGWRGYQRELERGQNRFRWVEYSLSSSLMIVLIAGLVGIVDIAALIALFGVNASMILFGWLMETGSDASDPVDWTPFVFGCLAGAVAWVAIGIYLFSADTVPGFVYGIFVSLFLFFNCFALNQWLQYRRIGPWRSYLFGERVYIVLSFVAKTLLAWQIFANVLVG